MNTKKVRYLISTTFFIFAFLLFLDFKFCLKGSNCTFHGLEMAGLILYPMAILFLGFVGLIFIALALVYKKRLENNNVAPQNIMYKSINPIVLFGIGTAMFLVTFFDSSIGLDLFGAKMMLFFGAILFLCVGFIKFFKGLRGLIITVIVFVFFVAGFSYIKYPELYKRESNEVDLVEDINNTNVSFKINPKDYSLVDYPFKESPIYNQLSDYCYKPENEGETIQKDTRLVKNSGEIIIPSIRQLIFASENKKPNCVTKIGIFSMPTDGKYLYLTVSELSFKEHMSWPVYRLNLSSLSVEKLLHVDWGGSIDTEEGFISNDNKLLPDGKRAVRWNEKDVFLINMETDSSSIIYTAPNNQWLVSNVNPIDVIGKFLDTDVKVNENKVMIGVYDQNQTFTKNPSGYQDYDINYVLVNRITIIIPDNQ